MSIRENWNRGDTIAISHEEIKDSSDSLVTDFTGWKFHATLKASKSDADASAIATLNTSNFTITAGSSKAIGYLGTESLSLTLGQDYYLDAQIIDGGGNVSTVLERIIVFKQDVTRRTTDS